MKASLRSFKDLITSDVSENIRLYAKLDCMVCCLSMLLGAPIYNARNCGDHLVFYG